MNTANSPIPSILLMVVFVAMIYFMMIRPQRKRDKADQEMRSALQVGDEIITIGGVVGKIEKITDKTVVISTTAAKNKIEFLKTSVASVSKPSQNANAASKDAKVSKSAEEEKTPNRDKKVTPKKLGGKKTDEEKSEEKAE